MNYITSLTLFLRQPCPTSEEIILHLRDPRVHVEYAHQRSTSSGCLEIEFCLQIGSMEVLEKVLSIVERIPGVRAIRSGVPRKIRRRIA